MHKGQVYYSRRTVINIKCDGSYLLVVNVMLMMMVCYGGESVIALLQLENFLYIVM